MKQKVTDQERRTMGELVRGHIKDGRGTITMSPLLLSRMLDDLDMLEDLLEIMNRPKPLGTFNIG